MHFCSRKRGPGFHSQSELRVLLFHPIAFLCFSSLAEQFSCNWRYDTKHVYHVDMCQNGHLVQKMPISSLLHRTAHRTVHHTAFYRLDDEPRLPKFKNTPVRTALIVPYRLTVWAQACLMRISCCAERKRRHIASAHFPASGSSKYYSMAYCVPSVSEGYFRAFQVVLLHSLHQYASGSRATTNEGQQPISMKAAAGQQPDPVMLPPLE
jgi:hypothetical protein